MKELDLLTKIIVCSYKELSSEEKNLTDAARRASQNAYAPYSRFRVGAAVLLADGRIVPGCNQENASYPVGLCAERTALFAAGAQYPDVPVKAIALAAESETGTPAAPVTPCGACRQVLCEVEARYGSPVRVLMCGADEVWTAASARDLLPLSFSLSE